MLGRFPREGEATMRHLHAGHTNERQEKGDIM